MGAAIYARISDDRDDTRLGVERQLEDCRKHASRLGWPIQEEYVDNNISAHKRVERPEYRRMLNDIAGGVVTAVIVYDTDRLHRQPRELEEFIDVCEKAGVTNLATVGGDIDLSNDNGRMYARIKGAVNAQESDAKSRRIKRKHLELAQRGKLSGGGTRPFGFDDDRVTIRPGEAKLIQEAASRVLGGEPVRSVCNDFNARGIKTSTGGEWKPYPMKRLLESGRISGQREHNGEIVAKAEWGEIISPADTARLRALLKDPERRKNDRATRYLLASFLRCGRCGSTLHSRPTETGRRRYVCAAGPGLKSCGKLTVVADELEELIAEMVSFRLEGPELARAMVARREGGREAEHQREVDEVVERLEELARAYAESKISMQEWIAARSPLEDRRRKAEAALARATGMSAVTPLLHADDLRAKWDGMTLGGKRAVLSALLEHIVIAPGRRGFNRFDPDRVEPAWRI